MLKRLARRVRALLRPWIDREVYECLTLPWGRATERRPEAPAGAEGVHVRLVERAELARLRGVAEYGISEKFLHGIVQRPDVCYGAFAGDALVSYAFFAPASPTAIDEHLRFQFPPGWIYVYKAFTLPAWRGQGLLPAVLTQAMPYLGNSAALPSGFVTLVISPNEASFKAFKRCGFQSAQAFPVWRVLARPCGMAPRRAAFSIDLARPETATQVSSLNGCRSTPRASSSSAS